MPTSQGTLSSEATQHKNSNLILICLALAILTVVTFWQLKECDFVNYDDNNYVYENGHVQQGLTWDGIQWAFSAEEATRLGMWHPVTWFSLMLDYEFFALNPLGYHLMNLLFHILNAILLFLIFHRMTKALWQSAFMAALFAIHPLRVESVAWVTERKDVLSTFFWMLTMGSYILYAKRKTLGRYFIIPIFFTIGLMAKPMLVTLPFVFILLDYWPLNRFQVAASTSAGQVKWTNIRKLIGEKLPLFALSGVFIVTPYLAAQKANAVSSFLPLALRIENALRAYVIYIWKMIWPQDFAVFYPYSAEIPILQIIVAVITLIIITLFTLWMGKRLPFLIVGWLWYLGTLLPVIGIIQAGEQAYADRYTYIPMIGLFIMVAWGVPSLLKQWRYRKEAFFTLSVLSILCLCIITWTQVGYWQNSITLFEHALKVTDHNGVAYNNLGFAHNDLGNYQQAVEDFNKAIEINPGYAVSYCNRGIAYNGLGNYKRAIEDFDRAIKINPGDAKSYYNLGIVYGSLGNYRQAIGDFDRAIKINPDYAEAYYNRGVTYVRLDKYTLAIEDLKTAARLGHHNAQKFLMSQRINWQ